MKSNPDRCSFICSTSEKVSLLVETKEINSNSTHERFIGAKIDSILSFNTHIDDLCKKASLKLKALSRLAPHLDIKKKKLWVTSFFISQSNYC